MQIELLQIELLQVVQRVQASVLAVRDHMLHDRVRRGRAQDRGEATLRRRVQGEDCALQRDRPTNRGQAVL